MEYMKTYYNNSLYKHFKMISIIKIISKDCHFFENEVLCHEIYYKTCVKLVK